MNIAAGMWCDSIQVSYENLANIHLFTTILPFSSNVFRLSMVEREEKSTGATGATRIGSDLPTGFTLLPFRFFQLPHQLLFWKLRYIF